MTRWLSVVGIGADGVDGLSRAARAHLDAADVLVGGDRHLAMIPDDGRERRVWPAPMTPLLDEIENRRGERICILATGDPMWCGVGAMLGRRVKSGEMTVLPSPSAFSLACARMGWPLAEVETVTLHGRPVSQILARLYPGARIVALCEGSNTPAEALRLLREHGFGASSATILEHMGGPQERIRRQRAADPVPNDVSAFNTIAVECVPDAPGSLLPRIPGLPDDAFEHDGKLTKREVRAATLAALAPYPGALLWDVGAGAGAIAIEWMRAAPTCRAVAFDRRRARLAMARRNAERLGVPDLRLVEGAAPDALAGCDRPDAAFIGGGLTVDGMAEACWAALPVGGRLVANAVTLEGEARLLALRSELGGELSRISVSRAEPIGPYRGWRPLMTVTQWFARKPAGEAE